MRITEISRITVADVDAEQQRLLRNWATDLAERPARPVPDVLSDAQWAALDEFDRMQLAGVIAVCQQSRTLAEAAPCVPCTARKAFISATAILLGSNGTTAPLRRMIW